MSSRCECIGRALLLSALAAAPWAACQAALPRYCDHSTELTAEQKDRLLRFGAVIKTELERSGASLALVARSGLDLARFGLRYSHAGISLKASPNTPWSVRQLYYACDERRPRLFDQGLSGFLFGTDNPAIGYVSAVLLPPAQADALEHAALDKARALQLLNATYSANAYAWGLTYQNCNQWVIELLASAWNAAPDASAPRAQAQRWLAGQGYEPTRIDVGNRALMWAGAFVPWLHDDDHPADDIASMTYRVSMPEAIEHFVHTTVPGATRIEFCHTASRIVVHRGWGPIAEGCMPDGSDTVIALDD
ncbi:MAG: DUF2145 domain-containing protein [Burkholderiales bacterium]